VISSTQYYQEGLAQLAGMNGAARVNALHSLEAQAPGTPTATSERLLAGLDPTLPHFTVDANGNPTLVNPAAPPPAPAPPPGTAPQPTPLPVTTEPVTVAPTESLAPTPSPITVPAGTPCPQGYVVGSSLLPTGAGGVPLPLSQQITGLLASMPGAGAGANGVVCGLKPSLSAGCPVTSNDFIRVVGYNANATAIQILITVRQILCDGTLSTASFTLPVPKRTLGLAPVNLICIQLTDGFLCSVVANAGGTPCAPGMIFVSAILTTGGCNALSTSITVPTPMVLFQDALTLSGFTGWPFGRIVQPTDLAGGPFGQNWPHETWRNLFWNPDSNTMARLEWVSLQITTSAVVGNRSYQLQFQMVGGGNGYFGTDQTQKENTTFTWFWAPYVQPALINSQNTVQIPIPADTLMTDNDQIAIMGFNTDVGDNIIGGGVHYLTYAGATV
jgi:hypothetical protein